MPRDRTLSHSRTFRGWDPLSTCHLAACSCSSASIYQRGVLGEGAQEEGFIGIVIHLVVAACSEGAGKIAIATVINSSVDIVLIVSFIFIPLPFILPFYFSLISTSLYSVEVCSSNSGLKSSGVIHHHRVVIVFQ